MSLFTTIKSRSASRYYATQGTRRSYKPKPLLGRYTDVVPLDLLRVQPGLNVRLREYETQCAKGRYAYDLKLQNGKVLPATGQNFMGPNGCSLRPSLSPMTQEIVRNFTVLGADMKIFLLKEGTRLPSLLTILHEHTDHYALQCTRPMSLDELNWELIDFMHENGRQMNQSQLEEEFPYIPF
ncbi:hypothetical protein FB45DRAFT_741323 [Roridomyces roridus]|uniref:Tse2 ADP-ribosyltransferase toxin domain-containing protein n=1 Tax=Roridomyces roridus TaxID=1738132 RepID=A0AAD7C535_9AGAR|nr:hypothetical protein FB45DRAFT_741323 [Roridomyces roridus]